MLQRAVALFSFEIHLALAPADALVLFTPEGERAWEPGWNPVFASEAVFTTDDGGRAWVIEAYDGEAGTIRYTAFLPGQTVTRIAINVRAEGAGSSARVAYDRTSISPGADADVAAFAEQAESMRAQWQHAIDALG